MQQYIYGNIKHEGYRYESSKPDHFADAHNARVLQHLVTYDQFCLHGELSQEEHQCYWMVTTNLDKLGEPNRLYLQASGGDSYRASFYAHGYMSDPADGHLYGPGLLRLLRTRFHGLEAAMAAGAQGNVEEVSPDALPVDASLQPAPLDKELLGNILLSLFQNKKVILRLPSVGKQAMADSRAYLLAIYERLPYALREANGFITGASSESIYSETNALPAVITVILMDADADVSYLASDLYTQFLDLTVPGGVPPMRRENNGKPCYYVPLMDFLLDSDPETLDHYFRYCYDYRKHVASGTALTIQDYLMLLEFFRIGQTRFTDDLIRIWAANLFSSKFSAELKQTLCDQIVQALTPEQLADYMVRATTSIQELPMLGILDRSELIAQGEKAVRDANLALSLRMAELLMPRYPEDSRSNLMNTLFRHFMALGHSAWPCLREARPTAATKAELEKLQLMDHPTDTTAMAAELKRAVYDRLSRNRTEVLDLYQREYQQQLSLGSFQIEQWNYTGFADVWGLEGLYQNLRSHYLCEELLLTPDWNARIAKKILNLCASVPQSLKDYEDLLAVMENSCRSFAANKGSFTSQQQAQLDSTKAQWQNALSLGRQNCRSIPQLLDLFDRITGAGLSPSLAQELKWNYASMVASQNPDASQILECTSGLCRRSADKQEVKLLTQILEIVPDLHRISWNIPLEKALAWLDAVEALSKAGLCTNLMTFQPWNVQAPARDLGTKIRQIRDYRRGKPEPDLSDPQVQQWVVQQFAGHTDLELLLARKSPMLRSGLVQQLAARNTGITEKDLQALYMAGCSREMLTQGASGKTSQVWKDALNGLFPEWPELAEAAPPVQTEEKEKMSPLVPAASVLLALAGILPAAVLLLTDTAASILVWSLFTAVLVLVAAICVVTGILVKEKAQKQILRWLGISLVPGILLTIVLLVLAML